MTAEPEELSTVLHFPSGHLPMPFHPTYPRCTLGQGQIQGDKRRTFGETG
jgi:hypothetical protein